MKNPTQKPPTSKDVDLALDGLKTFFQTIEQMKTSIQLLKVLLAAKFVGTDGGRIRAFVEELNRKETQLSEQAHQDIALQFEALKHLVRKGSAAPDA